MEDRSLSSGKLRLLACFAAALVALVCALALPASAQAYEGDSYAYSNNGRTWYSSIEDAINDSAANDGMTIVMNRNWNVSGNIYIPAGKKVTIDMNGYRVTSSFDLTFLVREGAELTLTSNAESRNTKFDYRGYHSTSGKVDDYTVTSGGLITDTYIHSPSIKVSKNATLTLDGVAIAGCYSQSEHNGTDKDDSLGTGTVIMRANSTLNMKNGAVIEHCYAYEGGGVYVAQPSVTVNIDNSYIRDNYASEKGGGLFSCDQNTTVNLTNSGRIDGNGSPGGGGVYLATYAFKLTGDSTGYISGNTATRSNTIETKDHQSGGGIHVADVERGETGSGLIENINIDANYSDYDGGGLEIDQQNITLRNCSITRNACKYEGGGIYVCNDGTTIDGCTITGNYCRGGSSTGNYEGGGVFVWHSYDLKLTGLCIIKGNTRGGGGSPDDVFLREDFWTSTKAYITGGVSEGSSVGIRTGTTGDRRIGKNISTYTYGAYFIDLDGYYVSNGKDEGGDLWQRHSQLEYLLKVNGSGFNRYKDGNTVAVSAPLVSGKVFWHWDADSASGLNPVSDYINEGSMYNSVLSFKMPQNDASVSAVYTTKTTKFNLSVTAPKAGVALSTTAVISSVEDPSLKATVPITWRVDGGENAVSGTAQPNTSYLATVSCTDLHKAGIVGSSPLTSSDVTLIDPSTGKAYDPSVAGVGSITLYNSTGAFSVVASGFKTGEGSEAGYREKPVNVSLQAVPLSSVVGGASENISLTELSDETEPQSGRAVLGDFDVSYTEGDTDVTVVAPAMDGYNFCNWEGADDDWIRDDVDGTVTVPYEEVGEIDQLVAVYTPVVTEVEVGLSAPEAGKSLDQAATKLLLKASTGESINLVDELGELPVTWSPGAGEDGTADFSTVYAALVQICDGEGFVGVEDVLASNAKVTVNDGANAASAGFAIVDDKLNLALTFAETRAVKATSVSQPKDVELTFEEAKARDEKGEWLLPKTADVALENDGVAEGDIEWQAVEGFDANATGAQEITVKGTITHVAYDGELDTDGLSYDVACTIKVAAPTDGGDTPAVDPDNGGEPGDGDGSGDEAGVNATDNGGKAALAKTNDSIPVFAVAAVVLVAVAAIAVAVVAAMRRRKG